MFLCVVLFLIMLCTLLLFFFLIFFFFFKQKTAYEMRISDWSSDVCSSDLHHPAATIALMPEHFIPKHLGDDTLVPVCVPEAGSTAPRFQLPGAPDAPLPHLAYSAESGMGRILAASLPAMGQAFSATPVFASHAAAVLHAMARDGVGVAWLPMSLVHQDLALGDRKSTRLNSSH